MNARERSARGFTDDGPVRGGGADLDNLRATGRYRRAILRDQILSIHLSDPLSSGAVAVSSRRSVDPVTREVVQNRLISIVREMSLTLQRAAYSPIIFEVKDFSSVLLRPNAEFVAQAEGIPGFLGCMHQTTRSGAAAAIRSSGLQDGDVFVSNDPFRADGTSQERRQHRETDLLGCSPGPVRRHKAHWTDIGGKDPGSWSPDARTRIQEGVSSHPSGSIAAGQLNAELLEVILPIHGYARITTAISWRRSRPVILRGSSP